MSADLKPAQADADVSTNEKPKTSRGEHRHRQGARDDETTDACFSALSEIPVIAAREDHPADTQVLLARVRVSEKQGTGGTGTYLTSVVQDDSGRCFVPKQLVDRYIGSTIVAAALFDGIDYVRHLEEAVRDLFGWGFDRVHDADDEENERRKAIMLHPRVYARLFQSFFKLKSALALAIHGACEDSPTRPKSKDLSAIVRYAPQRVPNAEYSGVIVTDTNPFVSKQHCVAAWEAVSDHRRMLTQELANLCLEADRPAWARALVVREREQFFVDAGIEATATPLNPVTIIRESLQQEHDALRRHGDKMSSTRPHRRRR